MQPPFEQHLAAEKALGSDVAAESAHVTAVLGTSFALAAPAAPAPSPSPSPSP